MKLRIQGNSLRLRLTQSEVEAFRENGVRRIPTTIIYDSYGNQVFRRVGALSDAMLDQKVRELGG